VSFSLSLFPRAQAALAEMKQSRCEGSLIHIDWGSYEMMESGWDCHFRTLLSKHLECMGGRPIFLVLQLLCTFSCLAHSATLAMDDAVAGLFLRRASCSELA
jgi:hypothetical protein